MAASFAAPKPWAPEDVDHWGRILGDLSLPTLDDATLLDNGDPYGDALPSDDAHVFTETEEDIPTPDFEAPARRDIMDVFTAFQDDPTQVEQLELALQYESLAYFASRRLRGPEEAPYHGKFLVSEHHEEWSDLIAENEFVCIQASRDHGKTFFCDFAYPIWQAWRNPGRTGFIFSATQPQARRILRDIREEIEGNPNLAHLMPDKPERWNDDEIKLANGHTLYARGYGTKVRGAHPVWIVCDDVLNDETAYSETQRRKQNDYFFNAIVPMRVPGGQIVVVGTPFHTADLYAELKKAKAFVCAEYPAILDQGKPTERALWPERYSIETLYRLRDEVVGSIRFTREYLVQPISDDLSLFPRYLFQGSPVEQPTLKLKMGLDFWNRLDLTIYQGVDFAIGTRADADFTVIFTMGVDQRGTRWILDIERFHGATYKAQKSAILAAARRWQPSLIFLESNQMQAIFGQELRQDTDLPIKEFHTTGLAKHSLERGLPSLRTLLENGKFRIPRGDAMSVEMTDLWIQELNQFLFDKGKVQSIGEHDDIAMACWICDQACRAGAAFSASFGVEDTMTDKELRRLARGERVDLPTVDQIIEEQTGIDPTTKRVTDGDKDTGLAAMRPEPVQKRPEDSGETDPFTGLPIDEEGNVGDWRPRFGAPLPSMFGGGWWATTTTR